MKRLILTAAMLTCATVLMAGMDKVIIKSTSVSTSSTPTVATSSRITGYVNRIDVSFGNSTSVVYMSVIATNSLTGLTTTLPVTANLIGTNVSYQLTNYVQRLSLYDEAIIVSVTGALYSGQSVITTVFYERP